MSDYTQTTFFTAKDSLPSGNAAKVIYGAEIDPEFSAIATAIGTKYDSSDLASNAQAAAGTADNVLMTPAKVIHLLENATTIGAVTFNSMTLDGGSSRILHNPSNWPGGVSTFQEVQAGGDGRLRQQLLIDETIRVFTGQGTTPSETWTKCYDITPSTNIVDFNERPTHDSVNLAREDRSISTSGTGLSGGGDLSANRTITFDQTGISITKSQISDLGSPLYSGDTAAALTITAATITTGTITTIELGHASDTTITRASAGQIEVEGKPVYANANSALNSGEITFSTSAASGGSNGDIWFQYT